MHPTPAPDQDPYPFSPIVDRPPLTFPGDARVAFYVGLNIERFRPGSPVTAADGPVPDPLQYGWRDYGNRVGFWRLLEVFDDLGLPVSAIVNAEAARAYPPIIDAGVRRGWTWVAHGLSNSVFLTGMGEDEERRHLDEMTAVLDDVLPSRPVGWLGPGLTETSRTPALLAERGFRYVLDWCSDDQPFPLGEGAPLALPYSLELNDFLLFMAGSGLTGPDYERLVLDQFEQLLADSRTAGRVMALPIHTFVLGAPHRTRYLARVLRTITSSPEVWVCTSDDLARHAAPQVGA